MLRLQWSRRSGRKADDSDRTAWNLWLGLMKVKCRPQISYSMMHVIDLQQIWAWPHMYFESNSINFFLINGLRRLQCKYVFNILKWWIHFFSDLWSRQSPCSIVWSSRRLDKLTFLCYSYWKMWDMYRSRSDPWRLKYNMKLIGVQNRSFRSFVSIH